MHRHLLAAAFIALGTLGAAPTRVLDPVMSLNYLVGNWSCSYRIGAQRLSYQASFVYDMGNNWLRESDSWPGGGSDEAFITYDSKTRQWTQVVMENERTTTVFSAKGAGLSHIVYHSVFPKPGMTLTFDRVTHTRYTLHFQQINNGTTTTSSDTCTKP